MLKFRLSENCHVLKFRGLNFAGMMKQVLLICLIFFFFSACNNKDKDSSTIEENEAQPEVEMKDAIANFPDSLILKENLAQYYRENGAYENAIAIVNEALQKDSLNARIWGVKATLHYENEDTLNAITSFETAVKLIPSAAYLIRLGSLYAQTKNNKALEIAEVLLKDKNASVEKEAIYIKGLYFTYSGDKNKAILFFDKCLAMDYTFMFAYSEKAIALYSLGKYEDAVTVLDKAVTLQNNFDLGYYWLGQCFEKLNNKDAAIESYKRALLYDPNYIEAKNALTRLGVP